MARTHGWNGDPPADDGEARLRILDAARGRIDQEGSAFTVSGVAEDLGVTRQTVYRYFPSAEMLLHAVALDGASDFFSRVQDHLRTTHGGPAELAIEGMAFTVEHVSTDPYLRLLLSDQRVGTVARGFTSQHSHELGRALLDQFPIDWEAHGFDQRLLDELTEHLLRIVQSFVVDPGSPPRRGPDLRAYLWRWVAPAIVEVARTRAIC